MTTVTIKSMALENFKGIARMDRAFDCKRENVAAKNGSGKTTLMYAWYWVLGMDVPEVIPKLENQELHNLETKVTVALDVDGYEYRLCRTQTEEWKTNRATGIEEKHTNKSAYAIDDVEFTLTNYKAKLSALFGVSYDKLEMLTNKDYFNTDKPSKWTWTARRKELFDLTGATELVKGLADKSDYELIADDLKKGFSTSEIRKAKMNALKATSNDKDRNLTVIAEKQNDIAKYGAIDFAALEAQKAGYEAQITELNLLTIKAEESGETAQLRAKTDALIAERAQLVLADNNERIRLKNAVDGITLQKKRMERYAAELKSQRIDVEALFARLLDKRASKWQGDTVCPTCGQPLPTEKVEQAKRSFELMRAQDVQMLEERIAKGKTLNDGINAELKELRQNYEELQSDEGIALAELDNFTPNPRIAALDAEIPALKAQAAGVSAHTDAANNEALTVAKTRLSEIIEQLAYKRIIEDLRTRVEELKVLNRKMTDTEMVLKGAIAQLDAYVAEQVGLVTESINGLFDGGVSFALFSENYAGAESDLKETCVCMYAGKTYAAMSTGERFIANLRVVQALQKAYGVNLPLFCDNAECFTGEINDERQIVTLSAVPTVALENCIRVQKDNLTEV